MAKYSLVFITLASVPANFGTFAYGSVLVISGSEHILFQANFVRSRIQLVSMNCSFNSNEIVSFCSTSIAVLIVSILRNSTHSSSVDTYDRITALQHSIAIICFCVYECLLLPMLKAFDQIIGL